MDTYTVSSSGSSSFCTDPTDRSHLMGAAAADGDGAEAEHRRHDGRRAPDAALASPRRKPETASSTMRKVSTDYTANLEQQTVRAAALQRYKMLVRSSRLVPGGTKQEEAPPPAARGKEEEDGAAAADGGGGEAVPATAGGAISPAKVTARSKSQRRSVSQRAGAAATVGSPILNVSSDEEDDEEEQTSIAAVSDDSEAEQEDEDATMNVAVSAVSNHRLSRRSPSAPSQVRASPRKVNADRSPAARPPPPTSWQGDVGERETEEKALTGVVTPSARHVKSPRQGLQPEDVHDATPAPCGHSSVKRSAAKSKSRRASATRAGGGAALPEKCPYPVSYENEFGPVYQPPEMTAPVVKPNHPRRDSLRPNFDPVREADAALPASHHSHSHSHKQRATTSIAAEEEEGAAAAPRGKQRPEGAKEACGQQCNEEEGEGEEEEMVKGDVAGSAMASAQPTSAKKSKTHRRTHAKGKDEVEVSLAGGSSTAFWVRPGSALYEMTASIAAKRKDHPPSRYEEDMGYARIDSGSHAASSRTRLSARCSSTLPDAHGSSGNSTVTRRSSLVSARGVGAIARSHADSLPHSQQQQRRPQLSSPRGAGAASRRQSATPAHNASSASADARVSDRQSQYFAKHCSRLASGRQSRGGVDAPASLPPSSARQRQKPRSAVAAFSRTNSSRTSMSNFSVASVSAAGGGGGGGAVKEAAGAEASSQPKSKTRTTAGRPSRRRSAEAPAGAMPSPSPVEAPRVSVAAAKASPNVSKKLQFDLDAHASTTAPSTAKSRGSHEDGADPEMLSPLRTVPQATPRETDGCVSSATVGAAEKRKAVASASRHADAAAPTAGSNSLLVSTPIEFHLAPGGKPKPTTQPHHQQQQQQEGTPKKSRRTEQSRVASESPARDECDTAVAIPPGAEEALDAANRAALSEAVRRHRAEMDRARRVFEEAKACDAAAAAATEGRGSGGQEHSASLPSAAQSHARMSTSAVVAAMLQGIVQQSRRVLPCYLCAEMQNVSTYALHVDICAAKTQMLLQDRGGMSEEAARLVEEMGRCTWPTMASSDAEKDAFSHACFQCAKALLVPCEKCHRCVRVHDAKEHELLCGRSYYENGKAGQRHREAVSRIENETD